MKSICRHTTEAAALLVVIALSSPALAISSVIIGGATFTCQNSCVVQNIFGQLHVSDSLGGWVQKKINSGKMPVPNTLQAGSRDGAGQIDMEVAEQ
jgi:hypothetical protein